MIKLDSEQLKVYVQVDDCDLRRACLFAVLEKIQHRSRLDLVVLEAERLRNYVRLGVPFDPWWCGEDATPHDAE